MPPSSLRLLVLCGALLPGLGCADALVAPQTLPPLPKTVSPRLAKVKPPLKPTISPFFISDEDLEKLPMPKQPKALHDALTGLEKGTTEERVAKLKSKVIADLVYVQGGSFMRGDFASLMGVPGVTRMTYNEDDKVVRKITLSDFWISRYKTTYAEFDVFADATGRERTGMEYGGKYRNPYIPAGVYWQNAKDYCQWLGKITGYPFDLPTEAQWEYAARSRGQFFMIATDNGKVDFGRNYPYERQEKRLSPVGGLGFYPYPIGLFQPNPLGIYDMSGNGGEWVNDWYAEDAFSIAEDLDPQGPKTDSKKVVRGWPFGDTLKIGANVWRRKSLPVPMHESILDDSGNRTMVPLSSSLAPSFRCRANPT